MPIVWRWGRFGVVMTDSLVLVRTAFALRRSYDPAGRFHHSGGRKSTTSSLGDFALNPSRSCSTLSTPAVTLMRAITLRGFNHDTDARAGYEPNRLLADRCGAAADGFLD